MKNTLKSNFISNLKRFDCYPKLHIRLYIFYDHQKAHGRMDGWTDGRTGGRTDGQTDTHIHKNQGIQIYTYLFIYVSIFSLLTNIYNHHHRQFIYSWLFSI